MMNVLTDILCDTSSMMPPQGYKVVLQQSNISQHDISSEQGPLHLLESVSQISSLDRPLNHSSPSEINIFNSPSQIHIPSNIDSGFEERSNVSVFSDSFPEIVPSWLTHDFMKVSDNLSSPHMLSNVSDIYSTNRETDHLEMLDLGFPPELTSHDVSNNLNQPCSVDSQKILVELPMQRFSSNDPLIIPTFNDMNNPHLHISMDKNDIQYQKYKQNDMDPSRTLMNSVLPCNNDLLHLPLPSNLTEQCLSSSSPSMISNSQSQSHVVCDKLPQINLNHLDSLLGNEPTLQQIQLLRHNFPDVRLEDATNSHLPHSCLDTYNPNGSLMADMLSSDIPRLPHLQDASVQVSFETLNTNNNNIPANLNCFPCSNVGQEMPIEIIQCFKCKFCDFISIHKCAVANHFNMSHSKAPALNISENNLRPDNFNAVSIVGPSEAPINTNGMLCETINITDLKQNNLVKKINIIEMKRKILPKSIVSDPPLRKIYPKKSVSEPSTEKNEKSISSHKKAWQKKMTRELGTYICEFKGCNVRFRSIDNLEYHRKCHTAGLRAFVCPECGTNFYNWGAIAGHLWRTHGNDMEMHKCDQCPFRTFSLSRLENIHKRIHSDECLFLCDTCGKSFKNGKQLRNHRVIHAKALGKGPEVKEDIKCNICQNYFSNKRLLRVHQNSVHSKIKPYLCKYCDYSASKKCTMELHMRSHTGEKPFKCDECEYCTPDHNTLRRHKMKHSGDKPYKCPLCSYSCNQANRYKEHVEFMHPGQNAGVMFICNICSFRTIKQEKYMEHMCEHETQNRPPGEISVPEIHSTDDIFPLAEAMDISLCNDDNLLANFKQHKYMQSFFNNLNVNMVTVGHEGVN